MKNVQNTALTTKQINELAAKFDPERLDKAIAVSKEIKGPAAAQYEIATAAVTELKLNTNALIAKCDNAYCNMEELMDREPLEGNA